MNDATSAPRPTGSETMELLSQRVSVRRYRDEIPTRETIDAVLRAAFRAPTSSNIQAYSVVEVRDPETKQALSVPTANQRHVAECPVFLAFCADLTRMELALARHGHSIENNNLEMGLVSSIDAALVGMSVYLAAESVGLKGVMIGAVRNDPEAVAGILGLPPRVYCVFGMCLGYPDEAPPQKPRMDFDLVVHRERYDASKLESGVEDYDRALAEHYRGDGRAAEDAAWTHGIDERFSRRPRDTLRASLARMGFDFA